MVEEKGEVLFTEADDANIPVNIWLIENEDEETCVKDGTWILRTANYMPRRGMVVEGSYEAVSEKREELVELIKKYILPLYKTAVKKLQAICKSNAKDLYYWTLD